MIRSFLRDGLLAVARMGGCLSGWLAKVGVMACRIRDWGDRLKLPIRAVAERLDVVDFKLCDAEGKVANFALKFDYSRDPRKRTLKTKYSKPFKCPPQQPT